MRTIMRRTISKALGVMIPKEKQRRIFEMGLQSAGWIGGHLGLLAGYPKKPFFILGCPRSGTTMINKVVSMHPDIGTFNSAEIWDPQVYKPGRDSVLDDRDVTESIVKRIKWTFAFYQRCSRSSVFLNTYARNSVRIPFIKKIFPNCKFIHIIRDGRAVAFSLMQIMEKEPYRKKFEMGKFTKPANWRDIITLPPLECYSELWVGVMEEVERGKIKAQIPKQDWFEFRYEDLCNHPEHVLPSIFEFMELSISEQLTREMAKIPTSMNFKWRERLTLEKIDKMNDIMGNWLEHFGYVS